MSGITETYNKLGIDPISRALGIEPKSWASKVTGALGMKPSAPAVEPTPVAPAPVAPAIPLPEEAGLNARRRSTRRRMSNSGRLSTVLTDNYAGSDTLG